MDRTVMELTKRAPRFETVLQRRAWRGWPGIAGLATGVALWVFLAVGVVIPLGDALAHFQAPSRPAAACDAPAGAVATSGAPPCTCECPTPPTPGARRG